MCGRVCSGGGRGKVIVYFLEKGIFMIIMTDLICGWIWVNFTYISWGVVLRCLTPKMSPFILIVYFLGKGIFMIIMTYLICGWIWVNFTYIYPGVLS